MKRFVVDLLEKAAEVLCQAPIRLGDENVPHPDIAIVSRSTRPLRPTDARS